MTLTRPAADGTAARVWQGGLASGRRGRRPLDDFGLVTAGNAGGPDYAEAFCRGVDAVMAEELANG